jgi:hypothetical protein
MSDENINENSDDPSGISHLSRADYNDQLADKITTLAGQINAANYRFLKLIAEFDRREGWVGFGIRSCAHWLNWKCSIGMTAAREKVRTARALEGLPGINAGFEKGELSFSKVRAMTRVATELNEPFLLMVADYGTAQHMEKLVKTFRTVSRCDDGMNACVNSCMESRVNDGGNTALNKTLDTNNDEFGRSEAKREQELFRLQQENRTVTCYQNDDGMWTIQAKLPAEEGSLLVKVLKELGDKIAEPAASDEANLSMGPVEGKSVTAETPSDENTSFIPDKLTFPQRRADALVALSEHYLASSTASTVSSLKPSLSSLKAAERCQLVLHVHTGDEPKQGANLAGELDASLDGRWLLPDAAKRLACDASLLIVKEDSAGNVLDIGRKSRIIPPAMSRALAIRDGGCQFPSCCESRYVEGHHIKHWADGGDTKLDNLVTLCRYHHQELHRGAFFLSVKPTRSDGKPVHFRERLFFSKVDRYFDSPFNRSKDFVIAANPAKFTCACHSFSELEKTLNDEMSEPITEKTAVTKWTGERMDLSMTIEGLMNYQPKPSPPPLRGI